MTADILGRRGAGRSVLAVVRALPKVLLIVLLRLYRSFVSPMTGPTCRYYPSCSQYALTAVERHGAVHGAWLAACRLARCHPWSPGGVDDVPPARTPEDLARHDGHHAPPRRSPTR